MYISFCNPEEYEMSPALEDLARQLILQQEDRDSKFVVVQTGEQCGMPDALFIYDDEEQTKPSVILQSTPDGGDIVMPILGAYIMFAAIEGAKCTYIFCENMKRVFCCKPVEGETSLPQEVEVLVSDNMDVIRVFNIDGLNLRVGGWL